MPLLRNFLILSAVIIFALTIVVVFRVGFWWPAVFFGDIIEWNWRSQFNVIFDSSFTLSDLDCMA